MSGWSEILEVQSKWSHENSDALRLSAQQALTLYEKADLHALRSAAMQRRLLMVPGGETTYMIARNINYTNICTINCQFCSFYRPPGHAETYTQSFEEISARIDELEAHQGVRILMQGGVNPELGIEWYTELLSQIKEKHPDILLDCFSPIEIDGIAEVAGISTLQVLQLLKRAGLDGLPGGGAEMLVDDIRRDVSPLKQSAAEWVRIMQEAQSLALTTSATNVFGFGESLEQRISHMLLIRDSQDQAQKRWSNGFTSFISWPVQLENNSYGRRNRGRNRLELGAGPVEYLRHVAISRLLLDNILHIQSSWPTMGIEVAQMALLGGADDAGSTMMEENVVSASGTDKLEASEKELQWMIARAGFKPRRRDSRYRLFDTPAHREQGQKLASPPPSHY